MPSLIKSILFGAGFGFIAVVPFVLLEAVNTGGFVMLGFPLALYLFLWLLGSLFGLLVYRVVAGFTSGMVATGHVLLTISFMIAVGALWAGIVLDQMPCFMGVPNCD